MNTLPDLFENNRQWAEEIRSKDPGFFTRLSRSQSPRFLWIGCSDSRVPSSQITGVMPGEIFVHRNIANVVAHSDLNLLSVIQYAVEILEVRHIIVCGHYGCGGVRHATATRPLGLIDNWLRHIRDVIDRNEAELSALEGEARLSRLCELNIVAQVDNLARCPIVREAWAQGRDLDLHGWIYSLNDGRLRPLQDAVTRPPD